MKHNIIYIDDEPENLRAFVSVFRINYQDQHNIIIQLQNITRFKLTEESQKEYD